MMHYKKLNYLWVSLTEKQKLQITKLIKKYQIKFGKEDPLQHCGGGTIGDYYRINLEYMVLDLLKSLEKK